MYVIDNGVLDTYSTHLTTDNGSFLEDLVYLTLRRRGLELGDYESEK
jgi:predicted AAA+ superfamily ATPase